MKKPTLSYPIIHTDHVNGSVSVKDIIKIIPPRSAIEELLAALKVVDQFKNTAIKTLDYDPTKADWHMIDYAVKTDCVIITVSAGMCG